MKRLLYVRTIAAGLILASIILLGFANAMYTFPLLQNTACTLWADDTLTAKQKIASIETQINDNFFAKQVFIESYGFVQRVLGKETLKEFTIAKDKTDKLHYVYFQTEDQDISSVCSAVETISELAQSTGATCLYLMPPSKIIEGETEFSPGVPVPKENETADALLAALAKAGTANCDLRPTMAASGIPAAEQFYNTDHHWTIQSAFWGYTQFVDYLAQNHDVSLDPDGFYTDLANYNQIFYPQSYLGSMGRTVGITYGGVDDFTLLYPKFTTNFTYQAGNGGELLIDQPAESFDRALLATSILNRPFDALDIKADKYFAYLSGNYGFAQITNHDNPDGLRVLFIKDSLAVPLAAFLSTTCAQVDLIDPRWYPDSIEQYVADSDYDFVVISVSPANLTTDFFDFK